MAKIYNADDVNIIIGGKYVTDFAEGSSIVIARNADSMIKTIGIKGEIAYAINNDKSGTVTFSTQHNSESNNWLDEYARNVEFMPVSVIDSNSEGGFKIQNNECVIMKPADNSRGLEVGTREWVIDIPEINM